MTGEFIYFVKDKIHNTKNQCKCKCILYMPHLL